MTPTQLRECLEALRWSQRGLAEATGHDERQVRRMAAGDAPIGEELAAWLRRARDWMRANPPPQHSRRGAAIQGSRHEDPRK